MTTTDSNGIIRYETSDPVSPLHTLLNLGMSSVSAAIGPSRVDSGWVAIPASTGSTSQAAFARNIGGVLYLRGLFQSTATTYTTTNPSLGTLPVGLIPPYTGIFDAYHPSYAFTPGGQDGPCGVYVTAAGVISAILPNTTYNRVVLSPLSGLVLRA